MPDITGVGHLIDYLYDMGPTLSGAAGPIPLTHEEMEAWQRNSGVELGPWESSLLRRLSIEYLDSAQAAKNENCPSPLDPPELTEDQRETISNKVTNVFKMLMATRPKRGAAK
jgi:hypothetical protein